MKPLTQPRFSWMALFFVGGLITNQANAQLASTNSAMVPSAQSSEESIGKPAKQPAPGTYQFICTAEGAKEAFLKDILVTAEELRRQSETVYYRLSKNVTLKVLSQDEVCSKNFKPLPEFDIRKDHE